MKNSIIALALVAVSGSTFAAEFGTKSNGAEFETHIPSVCGVVVDQDFESIELDKKAKTTVKFAFKNNVSNKTTVQYSGKTNMEYMNGTNAADSIMVDIEGATGKPPMLDNLDSKNAKVVLEADNGQVVTNEVTLEFAGRGDRALKSGDFTTHLVASISCK
ncbi:hypothetical protein J4N45_19035 [Vibrio sp. SCSIO 43140]|uniref:hypothetical protein n=1 Tax=Vibrio sp. SCSIO 43140 TaxID=2819100 RepID=UPI002074E53E|nr:hypothetical protein [Vibrio sp. SCSIO 43140]USD63097.1 hypothetical protein J4N45_19035 [Vibrio sp. SCSIO 43140]